MVYNHLKPKVSSDQKHMWNLQHAQKKQMSHVKNLYLFLCGLKIEALKPIETSASVGICYA